MDMKEEKMVTIITSVDQDSRVAGMRFCICGVKCSMVFRAASLWKTAASKVMCKVEVDLENFDFPRTGGQPRNHSFWRDVSQDEISFFDMDNKEDDRPEADIMEAMGKVELSLKTVVLPVEADRAQVIVGVIPMSSSKLWELGDISGTEKVPMFLVFNDELTLKTGPKAEDSDQLEMLPALEMNQNNPKRFSARNEVDSELQTLMETINGFTSWSPTGSVALSEILLPSRTRLNQVTQTQKQLIGEFHPYVRLSKPLRENTKDSGD